MTSEEFLNWHVIEKGPLPACEPEADVALTAAGFAMTVVTVVVKLSTGLVTVTATVL